MKAYSSFFTVVAVILFSVIPSLASAKPSAAENDWVRFNMAGISLTLGKTKETISVKWTFILQLKKDNVRQIKIFDVTDGKEVLLVDDRDVKSKNGKWIGNSAAEEFKKNDSAHWFYGSSDIEKRFKAVVTNSAGETKELVQDTIHPASERKMMLMVF